MMPCMDSSLAPIVDKKNMMGRENDSSDVLPTSEEMQDRPCKETKKQILQKHLMASMNRLDEQCCYRFCFNCSFDACMSSREMSSLMTQLSYAYSSLKKNTDIQIQYHITSFNVDPQKPSVWKNYDVNSWKICHHEKPFWEVFEAEEIVVLSPDAEEELQNVDVSLVYVIGGLVDRSISKYTTYSQAKHFQFKTRRLPLKTYGIQLLNPVLNIDTVVNILREYIRTSDWYHSFLIHLPKRKHGIRGPRGERRARFKKKILDLEEMQNTILADLNALRLTHGKTKDDASLTLVSQLNPSTHSALCQVQEYLIHKRKAQNAALRKASSKKGMASLKGFELPELPQPIPLSGVLCIDVITDWINFLTQSRHERIAQSEKCRQTPEYHTWWEVHDPCQGSLFESLGF